ncbi:MAG: twin-arginine translocation signal domain-containing protein, partial [Phenylobacterium sp.]|nr:twin-arginine translocation signal domain-containing protein [Phenylobacterium sp.]
MERRDLLKGIAIAGAAATAAATAQPAAAQVGLKGASGIGVKDRTPVDPEYIIPGRFKGKTL